MAFFLNNLVPVGGQNRRAAPGTGEANGRGAMALWVYRTEDAAAVVDTAGYFNGARGLLQQGDIILRLTINSSGVPQTSGMHIVTAAPASGNIDVADALALTVTNTD
jgi:hypothetical protein